MGIALILDTETTGKVAPELVEAAYLKVNLADAKAFKRDGVVFVKKYKPGKPIELGAMATHHIMDEDLVNCAPASCFEFPDDVEWLIGHNVDYDWEVIGRPDVKRICTLALSRSLWPEADSHSQSAMIYLLEREIARTLTKDAHSSGIDALNCKMILGHILKKLGDVNSWEDLWLQSEAARIPKVMPYGKYKGVEISKVPADYKRWLSGQSDVDPYLMKALREAKW